MTEEKHAGGRPPIWNTPEELEKGIQEYFDGPANVVVNIVDGQEVKAFQPTMSGLAVHLGVDRRTITNYANKDEFFPAIKKARNLVESALENHLYGKNVTGAIFNLKNNFGWVDKHEVDNKSSDGSMSPKSVDNSLVEALTKKLID